MKKLYLLILIIFFAFLFGYLWKQQSNSDTPYVSFEKKDDKEIALTANDDPEIVQEITRALKENKNNPEHMQLHTNSKFNRLLANDLLKFQDKKTKVIIIHEKNVNIIRQHQEIKAEILLIKYLLPNGERPSFNALIDSSTGEILERWNQSIKEVRESSFHVP